MSAPPPPYQNHPPQQPYGYPQPPRGPQRPPQRSPLQLLITIVIVVAVFGGGAWYVWDYNTNPNGGKAKAEASQSAQAEEYKKYNPEVGDCVNVQDNANGDPVTEIVDCGSAEAQYKTGDRLIGPDEKCGSQFDYSIEYSSNRGADYTLCFTEV
ncbi:LppU/SCO3897 family protein [Streptomyces sp. 8N706]|uniref:LppU/SCO3897 family protein n=1 Tax=Streptomyces sp. 8N706 TaxID=3457416 RepID=UPI003FCFF3A3